ncbi:MAG: hypothetical protein ACRBCT_09450 [Alphaproteobacteria bacterium]
MNLKSRPLGRFFLLLMRARLFIDITLHLFFIGIMKSRALREKEDIEAKLKAAAPSCEQFLYHGTSHPFELSSLFPRSSETIVQKIKGDFVFAADNVLMAMAHSVKLPQKYNGNIIGVNVFRSFTGAAGSGRAGQSNYYAIIPLLERFEAAYSHGYVYGVKPDNFIARGAGEYTANVCVETEYFLRINGLNTLMAAGIQIFALRDERDVDEFSYNWPDLRCDNERAFILDTESKKSSGLFRWMNKEEGYDIPEGPMQDWS